MILRRVERDLTEPAGGEAGLGLALRSTGLLFATVESGDAATCARVAEERDLMRTLVMLVARGPRACGDASRDALPATNLMRDIVAAALAMIPPSGPSTVAVACARVVDALSDADLQALVNASVSCGQAGKFTLHAIGFLYYCLGHAPLLRRLVGPAGLPLALAKLLAGEGFSEIAMHPAAALCLQRLIEAAEVHGPPLATWAKPIVKPLRAADARAVRGAALETSEASTGVLHSLGCTLLTLSLYPPLIPTVASGIPDFVSALRGGGFPAGLASGVIGNLAQHPGARAAALREGAVPAIVSLLYGKDGTLTPAVKAVGGEETALQAFKVLGDLTLFDDSRGAILATDAPLRLRGTLLGASMAGLAPDYQSTFSESPITPSLIALGNFICDGILSVVALVDTGAIARVAQLSQGGDIEVALHATRVLLLLLLAADNAAELKPVVDALRAVLWAFGPTGVHKDVAALVGPLSRSLCHWSRSSHEPQKEPPDVNARPWPSSKAGQALSELLVADAYFIPRLCGVILASPDVAFDSDLRELGPADVKCDPFYAGRILHYLDCYAGPAVAARLAVLAPEAVLRPVRVAAARGRWGRPMAQASGTSAEGEAGTS